MSNFSNFELSCTPFFAVVLLHGQDLQDTYFHAALNTLRTGLLNCLNARSRGLIQSEVRFL